MKQLLEAGVHFGHQTQRWNPKMAPYIFSERNDIHIINLQKAMKGLKDAYSFIQETAKSNKVILFVGTKKQIQTVVKEEAIRCEMPYVTQRWLGGTLTNFETIKKSIKRLNEIKRMEEKGIFEKLPKKEVASLRKEMDKLETLLGGIKQMKELPGAIFVVDTKKERIAILEGKKLNIPIVGIVDTNGDPEEVNYCIPGNDDAIRSVKLLASVIADGIIEGKRFSDKSQLEASQLKEKHEEIEEEEIIPSLVIEDEEELLPQFYEEINKEVIEKNLKEKEEIEEDSEK
ncbi:MAG: 30S ribosomal protein S2 [bacterium]|nr:30S ribosomal protein S2 [bacterium]